MLKYGTCDDVELNTAFELWRLAKMGFSIDAMKLKARMISLILQIDKAYREEMSRRGGECQMNLVY